MKEFKKVELIAKNLPTGSYAAGCPSQDRGGGYWTKECLACERTV